MTWCTRTNKITILNRILKNIGKIIKSAKTAITIKIVKMTIIINSREMKGRFHHKIKETEVIIGEEGIVMGKMLMAARFLLVILIFKLRGAN